MSPTLSLLVMIASSFVMIAVLFGLAGSNAGTSKGLLVRVKELDARADQFDRQIDRLESRYDIGIMLEAIITSPRLVSRMHDRQFRTISRMLRQMQSLLPKAVAK